MNKPNSPTKQEYTQAKETIKLYEKRQADMLNVHKQLSESLQLFTSFDFKVNKQRREIIFSGVFLGDTTVRLSVTRCSYGDKWNESIGKLIAVKKVLGEDISSVVDLVESEYTGGFVPVRDYPSLEEAKRYIKANNKNPYSSTFNNHPSIECGDIIVFTCHANSLT